MPLLPILLLLLGLPFFAFGLFAQISQATFTALGISPEASFLLFASSLVGSMVNIPVSRRTYRYEPQPRTWNDWLFYYPPLVRQQVIYVNLGGAVIPGLFSLWLLARTPLIAALLDVAVVAAFTYRLAQPRPGVGITMPAFIPPLIAVGVAVFVARGVDVARVAYIGGVLGTLIGADLLHLPALRRMQAQALSIGGAGVFDGIFLVGVIAALIGGLF